MPLCAVDWATFSCGIFVGEWFQLFFLFWFQFMVVIPTYPLTLVSTMAMADQLMVHRSNCELAWGKRKCWIKLPWHLYSRGRSHFSRVLSASFCVGCCQVLRSPPALRAWHLKTCGPGSGIDLNYSHSKKKHIMSVAGPNSFGEDMLRFTHI